MGSLRSVLARSLLHHSMSYLYVLILAVQMTGGQFQSVTNKSIKAQSNQRD